MKVYSRKFEDHFSLSRYFKKNDELLWKGDAGKLLAALPNRRFIDLVVTSPPYNIGKSYEAKQPLERYFADQRKIIEAIDSVISLNGSICWQVGNHITKNGILPLDFGYHQIFQDLGYFLKNRIIWKFGHGFHARTRLSGRYEVVLWYTKGEDYTFNLDDIRIPSKYPGKKYYRGPNKGKISSNPLGKNPEDVWEIPNVKGNHPEKTDHPCQFPVGLIEKLILGFSNKGDIVFDPYMGVASAGVAALIHGRKFIGSDIDAGFVKTSANRLQEFKKGTLNYRSHDKPLYDHTKSSLSKHPNE